MSAVLPEFWRWQEFPARAELAEALARSIAASLQAAVDEKGAATLAVSGGSTPKLLFQTLSRAEIDWANVSVTLCDERFVPPSSPRSNEGLVRANLLQGPAGQARFVPLYRDAGSIEDAAAQTGVALAALPLPFDVVVLGMGEDGHTASFFPDAQELDRALDPENPDELMVINAQSAGEPRLTLTLPPIAGARRVVLHIEGQSKRAVFERAIADEPKLPIRRVIEQAKNPVEVFWAP